MRIALPQVQQVARVMLMSLRMGRHFKQHGPSRSVGALPKLYVEGSIPFTRSKFSRTINSLIDHITSPTTIGFCVIHSHTERRSRPLNRA
jgi:hypothetical protein